MVFPRRLALAALSATLLATTAACSGGDDDPETAPSPSSSPTTQSPSPTEPTEPAEPSSTQAAWQDRYTDAQLDAYEAALSRYEEYETRSEPIWAEGEVTDRAEALFKQYFPSPVWQQEFERLKLYAANDVTVAGLPTVYWSKPARITKDGLNVEIQQCVNFADVVTTQDGEQAQGNKWKTTPHLRVMSLSNPEGYDWLIYSYGDPDGEKKPCTP